MKRQGEVMIKFGCWDPSIHLNDINQVQRIASGMSKKVKKGIVSLDKSSGYAVIKGSGSEPYECTLDECTCVDFSMRGLPCKHIYALADELGLLSDFPKYKESSDTFDPEAEKRKYKELFLNGNIYVDDYVKIYKILDNM